MTVRPGLVVERGGRLVADQQLGLVDQGPGDGHALHLAARELRRAGCSIFLPMPMRGQDLAGPADRRLLASSRRSPAGSPRSRPPSGPAAGCTAGTRSRCSGPGTASCARSLIARDVVAEDRHLALVGVEDAGDHREQRRLAAARGADDQRHLARVDVQSTPAQRLDALVAGAEVLGQPADPDGDLDRRIGFAIVRPGSASSIVATPRTLACRRARSTPTTARSAPEDDGRLEPDHPLDARAGWPGRRSGRSPRPVIGQQLPGREEGQLVGCPCQPSASSRRGVDSPTPIP